MPAPKTVEQFLGLVQRSGLLEPNALESFLEGRRAAGRSPRSARGLAQDLWREGVLTKYQAEQLLMGRWRNFEIAGKYRVLERLGFGGSSAVFLCEHLVMRRLVALKVLPVKQVNDPECLARFHREARAAAQLNHPNIVRAFDIDHDGKIHFIVTEYVDGPELERLVLTRGPLAPLRAANYIAQAALGLQHAHEAGMVHRDVKPSNLLVDRQGTVKLLDLGLARLFQEGRDNLTQGGNVRTLLGTIDYLAPEQAADSHEVDIRADIYALGASFYFLLTGKPPFPDGTMGQKISWHQIRKPRPICDLRPEVPERLAQIVDTMLAKSPADRFQGPFEVVEALGPFTVEPIPPPAENELPKLSRAIGSSPSSISRRIAVPTRAESTATQRTFNTLLKRPSTSSILKLLQDQKRPVITVLGALGGLAMIAVVGSALTRRSSADPTSTPPIAKGPRVVRDAARPVFPPPPTERVGPASDAVEPATPSGITLVSGATPGRPFATLREAVAAARRGDRVVVRQPFIEEALTLGGPERLGQHVTIEGVNPQGGPVAWHAPRELSADAPLIDAQGAEGLRLNGFRLDGQDRRAELVRITGPNPGLTLDGVQLQGATRAAVVARGAIGEKDRPIIFRNVRFSTRQDIKAALHIQARSGGPRDASRFLQLLTCRFDGPFRAALLLTAPATDLEVRHGRFFRATDALHYKAAQPPHALGLRFVGNTVVDLHRGLHFEVSPSATEGALLVLDNLFSRTPRLAELDRLTLQPGKVAGQWIWFDEAKASPVVPPAERFFRKSFELTTVPAEARLDISCDETFAVSVNGAAVGKAPLPYYTQRVYSFEVARLLRPGRNVIAVLGANHLDPLNPSFGTTAGLMAQLSTKEGSRDLVLARTDASWKANDQPQDGWERPGFDDSAWSAARPWEGNGVVWPWLYAVWDSVIAGQIKPPVEPICVVASGNLRDYFSWEGYPALDAMRIVLKDGELPIDPADDARFLRYPRAHPLARAGASGATIGLPETE